MSLPGEVSVDGARRGARFFVLGGLQALGLAPLLVTVCEGNYSRIG